MTLTNVPDPAQFCGRKFTSLAVVVDVPRYLRPFAWLLYLLMIAKSIGSNREGFDTFSSDGDRWSAKLPDLLCILISHVRITIVVVVLPVAVAVVVVVIVVLVSVVIVFRYCL
jgi:hypothetical protein